MSPLGWKILALTLLFIGEALCVLPELIGARYFAEHPQSFWSIYPKMFAIITVAGALLIAGYILGYQHFKNIWVVSAFSLASILVVEPFVALVVFHQWPTRGAWIALALGIAGMGFALFD